MGSSGVLILTRHKSLGNWSADAAERQGMYIYIGVVWKTQLQSETCGAHRCAPGHRWHSAQQQKGLMAAVYDCVSMAGAVIGGRRWVGAASEPLEVSFPYHNFSARLTRLSESLRDLCTNSVSEVSHPVVHGVVYQRVNDSPSRSRF